MDVSQIADQFSTFASSMVLFGGSVMVMLVTNGLAQTWDRLPPRLTALGLAFVMVFGTLLADSRTSFSQYYVGFWNALLIWVNAFALNSLVSLLVFLG